MIRADWVGSYKHVSLRCRRARISVVPHLDLADSWQLLVPAWAVVGAASVGALGALYLSCLALAAALGHPEQPAVGDDYPALIVVVPAHDEELLVGRCVSSLLAQDYPKRSLQVVVVADNCTDLTAQRALDAGARVVVREDPERRGKGAALRWAFSVLGSSGAAFDAVVVVDADSVADPRMLAHLAAHFRDGAQVVQAEYLALPEEKSAKAELRAAAFLLFHRVRFSGRAVLGMPCTLVGNGMLFGRAVLMDHPWSAFSSVEDLEYSLDLRLAGVDTRFAPLALVRGPVATGGDGARTQRLRWEGGRFHVIRTHLPRLLRSAVLGGRLKHLDAVVDLLIPPLGVLGLIVAAAALASLGLAWSGVLPAAAAIPGGMGAFAVVVFVLVGLWAANAPPAIYRALALAPLMVASDMIVRLRLLGGTRAQQWVRTPRRPATAPAESASGVERPTLFETLPGAPGTSPAVSVLPVATRFFVGGVPVDPLDMDQALRRLRAAIRGQDMTQVCTVNLDFLTNARRDPKVRALLQQSDLNLPDGAPVVWLGKILGWDVPGRLAGSDLVPQLMRVAAEEGGRVFLLGGEDGVAEEAARRMVEAQPQLRIAGVYAPPVRPLQEMDHEAIVRRVNAARTDILLVALGHPKQDRWLAMNRQQLNVGVAMGVGCTFDLIAGRRARAPKWMAGSGLEWLFRFIHEPRRLGARYATDAWYLVSVLLPGALRQRTSYTAQLATRPASPVVGQDVGHPVLPKPISER